MTEADRTPVSGDRAFLATGAGLLGVYDATSAGTLRQVGAPIPRTPQELLELFAEATRKATASDYFTPKNAVDACNELQSFLDGSVETLAVDDFGRWHDRYELLASKVTKADELARRAEPPASKEPAPDVDEDTSVEADEVAVLAGLTIEALRAELPEGMSLPDDVLREVVTSLRAGKHLLLGGPPGTGKSTLAEAVARAVMGTSYEVTTATADWTTFDTIGGYLPNTEGGVAFVPGVVLRALRGGRWLIIDEMNRADIDKAFGALFTLLNGASTQATRRATLPYQDSAGKPISITWAERRSGDDFTITDHWRVIGTLNIADKASLFQLSFAFLRRFAVIDVPLPDPTDYSTLLTRLFGDVDEPQRNELARAALRIAFGPRQIGPAILADVAQFVAKGISPVAGGRAVYENPIDAFLVATKLLVVPQYEGAEPNEGNKLVASLTETWPGVDAEAWDALRIALAAVALK